MKAVLMADVILHDYQCASFNCIMRLCVPSWHSTGCCWGGCP